MAASTKPTLSHILIEDYNVYRAQTQQYWRNLQDKPSWATKPLVANEKRLKLFDDLTKWCGDRGIEPRLWLHILFKARAWRFAPQCNAAHLMSEKMIPRYRSARGLGFFQKRLWVTERQSRGDGGVDPDPNRDIIHAVEAVKARYAESGQQQRCMDESIVRTNGYHPKSPVCQRCPLAGDCAIQLQSAVSFNVQGLRSGTITLKQAEAQTKEK